MDIVVVVFRLFVIVHVVMVFIVVVRGLGIVLFVMVIVGFALDETRHKGHGDNALGR